MLGYKLDPYRKERIYEYKFLLPVDYALLNAP